MFYTGCPDFLAVMIQMIRLKVSGCLLTEVIYLYIYIQYLQELHLAINSGPRLLTEDTVADLTE